MATVIGDAFVRIRPLTTGFAATTAAEVDAGTSAGLAGSTLGTDAELKGKQIASKLGAGVESETKKSGGFLSGLFGKGSSFEAAAEGSAVGASFVGGAGGAVSSGMSKISKIITLGMSDNPWVAAGAIAATAVVGIGYAALKSAANMQTAEVSIANSADITMAKARAIGKAFLGTSFQTQYSAEQIATAYATVVGQLGLTNGKALTTAQSLKFMTTAQRLAEASGEDLGTTTGALSQFMATFKIRINDVGQAADTLLNTSTLTKVSQDTLALQFQRTRSHLGPLIGGYQQYAALLVDAAKQGFAGRSALMAQSSGVQSLMGPVLALAKAHLDERNALQQLTPAQQTLAKQYALGAFSSSVLAMQTAGMTLQQRNAIAAYKTANEAVLKARDNQKELGFSVLDSSGKFIGWNKVIEEGRKKLASLHGPQRLAWADMAFGKSSAQQFMAVLDAGTKSYGKYYHAANEHGTVNKGAANSMTSLAGTWKMADAAFHNMFTSLGQKLMPVMAKVNAAIAHFIQHIVKDWPTISRAFQAMWKVVGPILKVLGDTIHIVWDLVTDLVGIVYDLLTGKWADAWKLAGKMFKNVLDLMSDAGGQIVKALANIPHLIGDLFSKIGPAAKKELRALPGQIKDIFMNIPKMLGAVSWDNVWNGLLLSFKYVIGHLIQIWDDTVGRMPGMHINNPYANLFNSKPRKLEGDKAGKAEGYAMDKFINAHGGKYTDHQLTVIADAAYNRYERKHGGTGRDVVVGNTTIHINVKSGADPKEIAREVKIAVRDHDKHLVDLVKAKGGTR